MQRFYEFIGQKRAHFTLGISVVLSFVLMSLGHSEKLALARSVATGLLETGHKVFAWPVELADLRFANQTLREQNLQLSMELVRLREAKLENQRLRDLLNFRDRFAGQGDYLAAKVIARDPDRIANTLLIDLGRSDGMLERMPVVTAEGLVGRVLESYDGTSVVQLLLDRNCRVSAVVQRADRTQGHRPGVGILEFDGHSGKADKGGIGQGIAHVAGKSVDKVVLAAVGFVGNDDDVAALGKRRVGIALLLGEELLDGGEHHAAHVTASLARRSDRLAACTGGWRNSSWQREKVPKS